MGRGLSLSERRTLVAELGRVPAIVRVVSATLIGLPVARTAKTAVVADAEVVDAATFTAATLTALESPSCPWVRRSPESGASGVTTRRASETR